MQYRIFIFVSMVASFVQAQNLIPNSGFEENLQNMVENWKHPWGDYYHYESYWIKRNTVRLERMYGLCLLNKQRSEFLGVNLMEPLQEGETYIISAEVKVSFNKNQHSVAGIDSIDIKFYSDSLDLGTRIFIRGTPDISFDVGRLRPADGFVRFEKTYQAKGDEKFLLIGKLQYPEINKQGIRNDSLRNLYEAERTIMLKRSMDEMMAVNDELIQVQNTSKAIRVMSKRHRQIKRRFDKSEDSLRRVYTINIMDKRIKTDKTIDAEIRFYFDNIIVRKVDDNYNTASETDELPFIPGETYHLQNVVFDTDKDLLKPEVFIELDNLVEVMIANTEFDLELTGHTDSINSIAYNIDLSERRALACKNYLLNKGVESTRVNSRGMGESVPLVSNDTEEGRALNRRVDFVFIRRNADNIKR